MPKQSAAQALNRSNPSLMAIARYRLGAAIAGKRKDFIPALSPFDGFSADGFGRMKNYKTKVEQITANIGWVAAANDAISEACAAVDLKLYRVKKDGDREEVTEHELLDLLDMPTLAHTGEQMKQLHFSYMNLVGESYILKLKNGEPLTNPKQLPDALQILPAHQVVFKLGETYSKSVVKFGKHEYPITAMLRDFRPDPGNPYNGRSIVAQGAAAIDTDGQMAEWNRRFFANNARPSLIFTTNEEMGDDAYERWKQQFNDEKTGTDNAFKPLLVENGTVVPYMMSQQDLDFLASRSFSKDEILAMFKLPSAMLGMTADYNRANIDGARYINAMINTLPRMRQFVGLLNMQIVKPAMPGFVLDFENPVPEDVAAKLAAATAGVDKWWTKDEVRTMYGDEALPDGQGEEILAPLSVVPLSTLIAPPAPATAEPDPENPLDPDEDNDDPTGDEDNGGGDHDTKGVKKKSFYDPEQRSLVGNAKATLYSKSAYAYEQAFLTTVRRQFDAQRDEVLRHLDTSKIGKSYTTKGWLDDLLDWKAAKERFKKAVAPILYGLITETGKSASAQVGLDPSQFDPFTPAIQDYYTGRSLKISDSINDETEKQLRATLTEGVSAGESSYELRARVEGVFGSAATYRTNTIANTEVAGAQGFADIEAWKQSGVVESKEFFQADGDSCDFCQEEDGKTVALEENFFSVGDSLTVTNAKGNDITMNFNYDDVDTPPLHPNCRCVVLPVRG